LFSEAWIEDDGQIRIDVEAALKSNQFRSYLFACSELAKV
jgi:hypothetical protein